MEVSDVSDLVQALRTNERLAKQVRDALDGPAPAPKEAPRQDASGNVVSPAAAAQARVQEEASIRALNRQAAATDAGRVPEGWRQVPKEVAPVATPRPWTPVRVPAGVIETREDGEAVAAMFPDGLPTYLAALEEALAR